MERGGEKSRKEKRKEARLAKQKNRFLSWVHHQGGKKKKKASLDSKPQAEDAALEKKSKKKLDSLKKRKRGSEGESKTKFQEFLEMEMGKGVVGAEEDLEMERTLAKKSSLDSKSQTEDVALEKKSKKKLDSLKKRKRGSEGESKTKFQEFLEMEMGKGVVGAEEDLEMERRLAKKLKVKNGKLGGPDDELNMLLEGVPSFLDSMVGDDTDIDDKTEEDCGNGMESVSTCKKKRKRKKSSVFLLKQPEGEVAEEVPTEDTEMDGGDAEQLDTSDEKEPCAEEIAVDASMKYVAPHLRAHANAESEELSQIRRRVRGLLNRLSESNVESITEEVASLFRFLAVLVVK